MMLRGPREEQGEQPARVLQVASDNASTTTTTTTTDWIVWKLVYTAVVLFIMFVCLIKCRVGADGVMLVTLTAFLAADILTVNESLVGFCNEGVLSVMVLFIVNKGLLRTGALDWYLTKWLGQPPPKTLATAQIRLMLPALLVSVVLNNTPIVMALIPIVQRCARNVHLPVQQFMIPLSFAAILGGTCSLIGTSSNLVVAGLLKDSYPNVSIGMFDVSKYGVPIALSGLAYVLLASPFLLPGGYRSLITNKGGATSSNTYSGMLQDDNGCSQEDLLLGARVTPWSPAAGRSIQRSGLRDTGGIYLVNVRRALTGHLHRAVSGEFILNAGDILYFTSDENLEQFGEFCTEHGLVVMTNEVERTLEILSPTASTTWHRDRERASSVTLDMPKLVEGRSSFLATISEEDDKMFSDGIPIEVGITRESLHKADTAKCLRSISRMSDLIRGIPASRSEPRRNSPAKIVVTNDKGFVVIGINALDRPGLLLDVARSLLGLRLTVRHTEAAVVGVRSLSIWRCDTEESSHEIPDVDEIWSVLSALLSPEEGIAAIKQRGLRVVRAVVTPESRLVNQTATQVAFADTYKAAIIAMQRGNKNFNENLSTVVFKGGDLLILQVSEDSALCKQPSPSFYSESEEPTISPAQSTLSSRLSRLKARSFDSVLSPYDGSISGRSSSGESSRNGRASPDDVELALPASPRNTLREDERVWRDLQVVSLDQLDRERPAEKEFLTSMQIAPESELAGKIPKQIGLTKVHNLALVSIERYVSNDEYRRVELPPIILSQLDNISDTSIPGVSNEEMTEESQSKRVISIDPDKPLQEGDVLWFSGPVSAVVQLRKIPGLVSTESEQVGQLADSIHERRLVQAVISRKGPLVGKTVKEVRFRTKYGAAVIAVHREGKRLHEQPGRVKLHAGDVLLLEAGPSFLEKSGENDRSFALLAEVEDSAPPRIYLLLPALLIVLAMVAVSAVKMTPLYVAALYASILMVAFGILTEQEARDAVNWETYVTIASAFGIGTALINSGLSSLLADLFVGLAAARNIGQAGILGSTYVATSLMSSILPNIAAPALIFPIAKSIAEQTETDIVLMCYAMMFGASASFMTPFGYTTNLLVYGPGRYSTWDFLLIGTPLQLILMVLSIVFLVSIEPWWISWFVTIASLSVVAAARIVTSTTLDA